MHRPPKKSWYGLALPDFQIVFAVSREGTTTMWTSVTWILVSQTPRLPPYKFNDDDLKGTLYALAATFRKACPPTQDVLY